MKLKSFKVEYKHNYHSHLYKYIAYVNLLNDKIIECSFKIVLRF